MKAFEEIFRIAKKNNVFKKKKLDVAGDLYDWLYYGDKNNLMVCETKPRTETTHCFRFATVNIVEGERRFTLLAIPMSVFSQKHEVSDELLAYAKKKININNVYVDRGFFNVRCIQVLQKHKVKWLMPAVF